MDCQETVLHIPFMNQHPVHGIKNEWKVIQSWRRRRLCIDFIQVMVTKTTQRVATLRGNISRNKQESTSVKVIFFCFPFKQQNMKQAPCNAPHAACPVQISPAREDYDTLLAHALQGTTLPIYDLWYKTCQDHNQQQAFSFDAWIPSFEYKYSWWYN